jgi:hypothetical protein
MLAQQASGYDVGGRNFHIQEQPMHKDLHFCCTGMEESVTNPSSLARQSTWSNLLVDLADSPVTSTVNEHDELSNQPGKTSSDVGANSYDWRTPLLIYLRDPSAKVDKSVQ